MVAVLLFIWESSGLHFSDNMLSNLTSYQLQHIWLICTSLGVVCIAVRWALPTSSVAQKDFILHRLQFSGKGSNTQ